MDFDFVDVGSGPALLFLPGSFSTPSAWRGVQNALQGNYRFISTSLPGYGGSREVRSNRSHDMREMVEFVTQLIAKVGAPVHLVAHSFGGLTALAAAMDSHPLIQSLITFEAIPVFSKPHRNDYPWLAETNATKARFESAFAAGLPDAAAIIIDHWGGAGSFAAMPAPIQAYCQATAQANIYDWRCAEGFTPRISEYSKIEIPLTLVHGGHAHRSVVDVSADIAQTLKRGTLRVVHNAGHFLITTHPTECAALIDEHMQHVG